MRFDTIVRVMLPGLALAAAGCNRGQDNTTASPTANIQDLGPEVGSNTTGSPSGYADNASAGTADNGNVAPGDINPNDPRSGAGSALSNRP